MITKQERLNALENQIRRLKKRIEELGRRSDRYSWIRLGIFIGGLGVILAAFYSLQTWPGLVAIVLALVVFNVAAYYHRQVDNSAIRHKIWLKLKQAQVARMQLDWSGIPANPLPEHYLPDHPFEVDLDLTGERSIHQLIDTSITHEGSHRLKDWMLNRIPDAAVIARRQKLVKELAPRSVFRDKLILTASLASKDLDEQWEGKKLLNWLERHASSEGLRTRLLFFAGFSAVNLLLIILSQFRLLPNLWVITIPLYFVVSSSQAGSIGNLFDDAYALKDGLDKFRAVLGFLEKHHYRDQPELRKLCEPILDRGHRPSAQLRRVALVASGATLRKNAILWIIVNALIPWDFYFADRLNACKKQIIALLPGWLDVWFELEALNSLANFTYLHPGYAFPEIISSEGDFIYKGAGLGHPLILDKAKVCNDFCLDRLGDIVIITGSNMAGKSSFLRTLGVNLCLAYAGGPVNADRLQTGLFRVFTCIKVSDSVTDGYSYFYAEVRRLKALLNELERPAQYPLFFLIDEIFRGTNNRERLIGSRAYMKALVGKNGVGAISTHDLELVKLAEVIPEIKNYHFREEVIDNRMIFDYKLRLGPCPTTNALKIMEREGLPVRDE